jgi:formylglycine-generating enzyme
MNLPKETTTSKPTPDEEQPAGVRRELTLPQGCKFPLRYCPPGTFVMGSPIGELAGDIEEFPHEVTLTQGFWLAESPVTQAQWFEVVESGGVVPKLPARPSFTPMSTGPVDCVSWDDCHQWLTLLEAVAPFGDGWRWALPTEAQWEYACRAGTTTPFHFGTVCDGTQANCYGTSPYGTAVKGPSLRDRSPVGSYPANAWGLVDMHGNVSEWCADWHGAYPKRPITDPRGQVWGPTRVIRGGNRISDPSSCRSAARFGFKPDTRFPFLGFRPAAVPISRAPSRWTPS